MRKPDYVALFVLSGLLAACAKAEFAPIKTAGTGGTPGGTGGVVAPPEDAAPLECETAAVCVSSATGELAACPYAKLCHATSGGLRPGTGVACSAQNDNCAPGNLCLSFGDATNYCFQLCSVSQDCAGLVACSGRPLEGDTLVKVCDPQPTPCSSGSCCDPLGITNSICDRKTCYLVAPQSATADDSRTVCDVPTGNKLGGATCISSHECAPPLGCYVARQNLPGGLGVCKSVCNLTDENRCGSCTAYNKQYGFCL